jgi:hypothetical protein
MAQTKLASAIGSEPKKKCSTFRLRCLELAVEVEDMVHRRGELAASVEVLPAI